MNGKSKPHTPYATIVALVVVAIYYLINDTSAPTTAARAPTTTIYPATDPPQLPDTFNARADGAMVESIGTVKRILPDDNEGSRHQRFILELGSGQTVLVAHNIDLAPRIDALKIGDRVLFRGQFETNDRGGVIHWTHHDPRGEHPAGWLEHDGRRYE
jgi:hypothetical protein